MDFRNFFNTYVFEVNESVFRCLTRRLCSGDLENPSQLPIILELEGTDGWVSWIFVISSFPTFSKSMNLFLVVSQSYQNRVTSKIQVNFRFRGYSRVLSIGSYGFQ